MSETRHPVEEAELHAFVDGQLDPARRALVAEWLLDHQEAAERVRIWELHRDALRMVFARPNPPDERLDLMRLAEMRLRSRPTAPGWSAVAAAAAIALIVGGTAGWYLGARPEHNDLTLSLLEQQAFATHAVYAVDRRHPIEVAAAERDHLAQWLSNRLSRRIAPPDLTEAGWRLLGGRLLATEGGNAAALFMYDNPQGERLSVVMRPTATNLDLPLTQAEAGTVNANAWIDRGVGYAVVGPTSQHQLSEISKLVRRQEPA